jgi:CDP-diacylglycerol--serine O-phosphatidyltransferase
MYFCAEFWGGKGMKRLIGVYDYTVILTYLSLFSAVIGQVQAGRGKLGFAVACVAFSGFCDAFDGAVARTKKNRTEDEKAFGLQLDSLCDVICFGIVPAYICHAFGVRGVFGVAVMFLYTLCAVIRLAFFNVIEAKRQQTEEGKNKYYRGLPVTSISIVLPITYLVGTLLPEKLFVVMLYIMLAVVGLLFVVDFRVKKPDWDRMLKPGFAGKGSSR